MKAHEILKENNLIEEVRRKRAAYVEQCESQRKAEAFDTCGICGGKIQYASTTDWATEKVTEHGCCDSCGGQTPTRQYSLC